MKSLRNKRGKVMQLPEAASDGRMSVEQKYGRRGERYVKVEAGHAAQNILLQAVSEGIGAVPVGAFYDEDVRKALGLPSDHEPLYLIPLGQTRK
jgi:nitroreductase